MNLRQAVQSTNKETAEAARYIELLSCQTGTPLNRVDVLKVFGRNGELITEKNEINKRFFKYAEKAKTRKKALSRKTRAQLDAHNGKPVDGDETRNPRYARLHAQRDRKLVEVSALFEKARALIAEAAEIHREMNGIARRKTDIGAQIDAIVAERFWVFKSLEGSTLNLVTAADVVVTHKDRHSSDTPLQVNLGRYRAEIDLEESTIGVYGYQRNIYVDGDCIHPHIYEGMEICWGNADGTVAEYLVKGDYAGVLRILAALLTTYNHSNPFVTLGEFEYEVRENGRQR